LYSIVVTNGLFVGPFFITGDFSMEKDTTFVRFIFAVLIAFAIPDAAWAAATTYGPALQPGTVFDGITSTFQNSTGGWMNAAQGYAKDLFLSLSLIEFTWAAIQLTIKKGELQDMIASTMMKIVGIGFFYSLLMMAPTWIPAIMNSFGMAGAAVGSSGGSAAMLSPSGVFDQGISIASAMVSAMNTANSGNVSLTSVVTSGGASIGSFLFGAIVTGLAGLMTILAFTAVAVQLMVTLIESYVIIGGGMLMMGFLGSRWTLPFGEKYFGYAVSTGIKLFTLYLIVGQGQAVANQIVHALVSSGGPAPGPIDFLGAGASSVAYGAMGYMVPAMAGSMMNGSPSLSLGNMAGAAGGMMGSIVGAGAMAASTALSGLSAASGAFSKTTKAAGNIGGDAMGSPAGSIGGATGAGSGNMPAAGSSGASSFGAGSSSPVAAPPGMQGEVSKQGGAQAVPAPAAMSAMADTPTGNTSPAAPVEGATPNSGGSPSAAAQSIDRMIDNGTATNPETAKAVSDHLKTMPEPATAKGEVSKQAAQTDTAPPSADTGSSKFAPAVNLSSTENISAKGGTDAAASTKKTGIDLSKKAESLNDMARRMDRLPANDGHSGGISIKFNHIE